MLIMPLTIPNPPTAIRPAGGRAGALRPWRYLIRGVLGIALALSGGVWLTPSLQTALAAAAGRDVAVLLDARSPGGRLAGALLTKVKKAFAPVAHHRPVVRPHAPKSAGPGRRSRLIARPSGPSEVGNKVPVGLTEEDILHALGPIEGINIPPLITSLVPAVQGFPGAAPLILIGGGSGSGSGGGGIGGGGGAGGSVLLPPVVGSSPTPVVTASSTADTAPAAPVPEPATWMSMVAGFGITGAALRRRKSGTKGVAAR